MQKLNREMVDALVAAFPELKPHRRQRLLFTTDGATRLFNPSSLDDLRLLETSLTDDEFESYRWRLWHLCKRPSVMTWHRVYLTADPVTKVLALSERIPPAQGRPWHQWLGGDCPLENYERVDVRFADGTITYDVMAAAVFWRHKASSPGMHDVVAYRKREP